MQTENIFETPMMTQYMEIKSRYPDCLLFFRLGDFYELFLEDAKIGAEVMDITLTQRSRGRDGRIPMAGVPYHAVDSYLSKLIKAGYKVAICEQLEDASVAEKLVMRDVVRVVTPGTVLDERLLEKKRNNYIVAVDFDLDNNLIGMAFADISTGDFFISEWYGANPEQLLFNEFAKFNPSECLLSPKNYNNPLILKLIKTATSASIYCYHEWDNFADANENYLKSHFKVKSLVGFNVQDRVVALRAASCLLSYLKSTQKSSIEHIKNIRLYSTEDHLSLDRSTIVNLELFSTIREGSKRGSLINCLDHTHTSMGGRLLKDWLLKPLIDLNQINSRLEAVEELISKKFLRDAICGVLREISDIERLLARVSSGLGNPKDINSLKESLKKTLYIKELLFEAKSEYIKNLALNISQSLDDLITHIENVLKESAPFDPKQGGVIQEGVNTRLDELKQSIRDSKEYIASLEIKERERTGINSLKVRFNKVFGYYIEISRSNLGNIPSNYFRKQTLVNAERFITEDLKKHEEIILAAEETINLLEYEIFLKLIDHILSYVNDIQSTSKAIATLDCIINFAIISEKYNYVKPIMHQDGVLNIVDGRHPVVERLLEVGDFVPNDTLLDNSANQLMLISGPNMAGKSVYIRQVALICLMAQMGCFVPAKEANLSIVDKIFVRSGASDVIAAGLSTFMVEMVETANILNNLTTHSLIVMDEIGRGTSTYDGISIAQAIAEYLVSNDLDVRPKTLFATHYHELQELEKVFSDRVKNYQMLIKENNGDPVFLHKIVPGAAGHSYGIAVAKLAGVPSSVTDRAWEILEDLENSNDKVIETSHSVGSLGREVSQTLVTELRAIDISRTTPLEALNKLVNLQDLIELQN